MSKRPTRKRILAYLSERIGLEPIATLAWYLDGHALMVKQGIDRMMCFCGNMTTRRSGSSPQCFECHREHNPKIKVPAVGRYVRVTDCPNGRPARVDVIGRVKRIEGAFYSTRVVVSVPNWYADGLPMDWVASYDGWEYTTKAECLKAARER